jgi:hypothetical protein
MIASTPSKLLAGSLLALALGACGDPASTYPWVATGGSTGSGGSKAGSGGVSGSGETGGSAHTDAGPDAPSSTGGGSGSGGAQEPTDAGPAGPFVCDPATSWSSLARVDSLLSAKFARFSGISGDALSVAFTSTHGDAYVADRDSPTGAFGDPAQINASVSLAADRVGFSPTGMSVVAVSADRHAFVGFERPSRADVWTQTSALEFTQVRAVLEGDAALSNPVLGADKRTLFFLVEAGGKATLYESRWDMSHGFWGAASSVSADALQNPDTSHLRRPTGSSADGLTLFFFDESRTIERGAWRNRTTSPFTFISDLGSFDEAAPTTACDTLYHQAVDDTGTRLYLAE